MADSQAGHGVTITFGTSAYDAEVVSLGGIDLSRESIETTTMLTSGGKTFIPSKLVDNGELSATIVHDPDNTPPISAAAETITLTWPIKSGDSTGAQWVFTGFVTGYSAGSESEERIEADITIKVSGNITYTPGG